MGLEAVLASALLAALNLIVWKTTERPIWLFMSGLMCGVAFGAVRVVST